MAAQTRTLVDARTPHLDRGSSELIAFVAKLAHESFRDRPAAAPVGYIFRDGIEIILGGRRKAKPWHSGAFPLLLPVIERFCDAGSNFLIRIATALLVGAIDVRAQGRELGLIFR